MQVTMTQMRSIKSMAQTNAAAPILNQPRALARRSTRILYTSRMSLRLHHSEAGEAVQSVNDVSPLSSVHPRRHFFHSHL